MEKRRKFGELELGVLAHVREAPRSTVRGVQERIGGEYNTLMTVMNRLVAKGELHREKEGRRFVYWAPEVAKGRGAFRRLLQQVFGGRALPMARALVEEASTEELAEIEALIAQARRERG